MQVVVLVAVCVAAALFFIVWLPHRSRQKLRRRIAAAFGTPPQKKRGLTVAEDFLAAYTAAEPALSAVDDTTWADLDGDDLFFRLNGCQSATGDVMLYTALRRPVTDPDAANNALCARRTMMALFQQHPTLRAKVQYRLARLGRLDGDAIEVTALRPQAFSLSLLWLYPVLAVLPLASIGLFWLSVPAGVIALVGSATLNFWLFTMQKEKNSGGFRWARFLAASLFCAGKLASLLHTDAPDLAQQLRTATRGMRPVRGSVRLLMLDHQLEETIDFDPLGLLLLPIIAYGRLAARLSSHAQDTLALYRLLGEIDLSIAVLSYRESLPFWCAPQFVPDETVAFTGLVHPLLDDAVPNSATFDSDVLLTGSNASGKSTFIKSIAINCLLAQSIGTCTAQRFALHPGAVVTSMAVRDDVQAGDSYFVAEIKSMRRLLLLSRRLPFCWFFIDEILKGTNTVERIAASAAVLCALHEERCLCFAATHDIELTSILAETHENHHFTETVTDGAVSFDYQLRGGPSQSRNAILLLSQMHFPDTVTTAAQTLVARFEDDGE